MGARLCTILARGGSKGVPGKNVRLLAGKPLIAHTVEQAKASQLFDVVAVSSDATDILDVGQAAGADELIARPADMATDEAGKLPAIRHCVAEVEARRGESFGVIVDLQPTSPVRLPEDIRGAVEMQEAGGWSNVISASEARCSPYFNLVEARSDGSVALAKSLPDAIVRRQDAPKCFDLNGSIYVWRRDALMEGNGLWFEDTHVYPMPAERSVDIDTEMDFQIAELMMSAHVMRG